MTYLNPTPEELAAEVADEQRVRDEMAAEYEDERIAANVAELRQLGWAVEAPVPEKSIADLVNERRAWHDEMDHMREIGAL